MFDDSQQTNQSDTNQNNDVGGVPVPSPSVGLGSISEPTVPTPPPADDSAQLVHPTAPVDDSNTDTPADDNSDSSSNDDSSFDSAPTPEPVSNDNTSSSSSDNSDLSEIKRKALDELSPLVHKLDQAPEEKYKTLMMLIQASDNQDLLEEAYNAAQKISDEKAKAEALLNIVNEINYFSQKG